MPPSAFACWHHSEKSCLTLISKYFNSCSTQKFTQIYIYLWWKEKKGEQVRVSLGFAMVWCKLAQGFRWLSKAAYWNTLVENEALPTALSKTWWSQSPHSVPTSLLRKSALYESRGSPEDTMCFDCAADDLQLFLILFVTVIMGTVTPIITAKKRSLSGSFQPC